MPLLVYADGQEGASIKSILHYKDFRSPNHALPEFYLAVQLNLREQRRTIREVLPAASRFDPNSGLTEAGFDLVERMLAMNPSQRISADSALDHEWCAFPQQPSIDRASIAQGPLNNAEIVHGIFNVFV